MVLEKTLESPLDCKEIQPVHSEGDQSWVFFGRNDAKAETPEPVNVLPYVVKCTGKKLLKLTNELSKVMTNLDSRFKSRDITLLTKVHLVKAMVFPVVRYGCESWTVKKDECRRADAFELWCWRRLLRVPWTARRCNQSILKEISPGCSLEGLMLKLKLQYFGQLIRRVDHWKRL